MAGIAFNDMTDKIKTLPSGLQYSRDFSEYDGSVVMYNAKTVERYRQLQQEKSEQDCYKFDCFFAFSNAQFAEGLKKIRPLKEGEKLVCVGAGMYGTRDGVDKFFASYHEIDNRIKQECDPQEVYFYEYNNHESMISWDGDAEPFKIITRIWGKEVAASIVRLP